ncbi:MAG: OmpA family protein [Pseudomonadota bacterium]
MSFRALTRLLALATGLSLALSAPAADGEGQIYVTPFADFVDDDTDRSVDDDFGGSLAIGYTYTERWSVEAFAHTASLNGFPASNGQDHLELGINGLAVFDRDSLVSPYLLAGLSNLQIDFDSGRDTDRLAANIGAGFLISTSDRFGLRFQYRLRNELGGGEFSDSIYSVGLQFAFGDKKTKIIDSDGDGVPDMTDRCPNTPPGIAVDSSGCERDDDGDGVKNSADQCPNTAAGASVDANGCERDDDGDGVKNSADKCPNTPRGADVDANGCERDDDGDGVKNSADACPNTPAGANVDVRGCEIKAGDVIELPGVNFETNSDRLLPGAEAVLNEAAATLAQNPDLAVEVAGHTDSDGAAAYNASLSERRARTVRNYLVERGANGDNLSVRGYGEESPVADNGTAAGKAANRRVELRILNR